jgi:hypothetical protein
METVTIPLVSYEGLKKKEQMLAEADANYRAEIKNYQSNLQVGWNKIALKEAELKKDYEFFEKKLIKKYEAEADKILKAKHKVLVDNNKKYQKLLKEHKALVEKYKGLQETLSAIKSVLAK